MGRGNRTVRLVEMFEDERDRLSFGRVQGFVVMALVVTCMAVLTIKSGSPMALPDSWLTLLGIATGGYLGTKGIGMVGNKTPSSKTESTSVTTISDTSESSGQGGNA
jgi:hypothetical protein